LYIQADLTHIRFLLKQLEKTPKPILFREEFLYKYLNDNNITDTETLNPDSFLRNIYESLFIELNFIIRRSFLIKRPVYKAVFREFGILQ
jgi:hypothetical protein